MSYPFGCSHCGLCVSSYLFRKSCGEDALPCSHMERIEQIIILEEAGIPHKAFKIVSKLIAEL
jgi:hypothetical protein